MRYRHSLNRDISISSFPFENFYQIEKFIFLKKCVFIFVGLAPYRVSFIINLTIRTIIKSFNLSYLTLVQSIIPSDFFCHYHVQVFFHLSFWFEALFLLICLRFWIGWFLLIDEVQVLGRIRFGIGRLFIHEGSDTGQRSGRGFFHLSLSLVIRFA